MNHLAHGVPSLPVATLPARYAQLLELGLPLTGEELDRLERFLPRFEELCRELASDGLPYTLQHDDLHMASVYVRDGHFRILDWGDSSICHPFFSLIETFRFLEGHTGLASHDAWFARLRDAYLEPWGRGAGETFELAMRVGQFAHAIAWARQREFLGPGERRPFDEWFAHVLRRALDVRAD